MVLDPRKTTNETLAELDLWVQRVNSATDDLRTEIATRQAQEGANTHAADPHRERGRSR